MDGQRRDEPHEAVEKPDFYVNSRINLCNVHFVICFKFMKQGRIKA